MLVDQIIKNPGEFKLYYSENTRSIGGEFNSRYPIRFDTNYYQMDINSDTLMICKNYEGNDDTLCVNDFNNLIKKNLSYRFKQISSSDDYTILVVKEINTNDKTIIIGQSL